MEDTTQTPQEQPAAEATPEATPAQQPAAKEEKQTEEEKKDDKKKSKVPQEERFLAAISYLPPLFILALVTKPNSKYCQFHAKQGLGMFAVDFLVLFILAAIPMIGSILFLCAIALSAVAIFQGYQGTEWKIPVLGDVMGKMDLSKFFAPATPTKKTEEKKEDKKEGEESKPEEATKKEEKPAETPAEAPAEKPKEETAAPATTEAPATPEAPKEETPKEETPPQQ